MTPYHAAVRTEKVRFTGAAGQSIAGLLDTPSDEPIGYAIFAHCFTCSKNLNVIVNIARQLTREGIALLRFDFTGLGQSEGEFAQTTFTTNTHDLVAASEFLATNYRAPAALIGHSLGGAAVLNTVHLIPSARCVATIGAPADPIHIKHLVADADFDEAGVADVAIGGRPVRIGKEFVDDLETHDSAERIANLGVPLLIFHSPVDAVVGVENAEWIYKAAKHPKSFVSLGGADHLVSDARDAAFLGHVLSAWLARYIE